MTSTRKNKHSPAMYKVDEAISALRCCIRQALPSRAMFWATQVMLAEETKYLVIKLLPMIASEDVGFGWGGAMAAAVSLFSDWKRGQDVRGAVLTLVHRLCRCRKNRMVASAAGALEALDVVPSPLEGQETAAGGGIPALLAAMTDAITCKRERRSLELAHWAFVTMRNTGPDFYRVVWKHAWSLLLALPHPTEQHLNLTRALYNAHHQGLGSSRALWFQAVLLHFYSDVVPWETPTHESMGTMVTRALLDMAAQPELRTFEITCDMLDTTTDRGRGTSTLHLVQAAAVAGGWDEDEIVKSHSKGLVAAASTRIEPLLHLAMRPESKVFDPYAKEFSESKAVDSWSDSIKTQLRSKWGCTIAEPTSEPKSAAPELKSEAPEQQQQRGTKRKLDDAAERKSGAAQRQKLSMDHWCGLDAKEMTDDQVDRVTSAVAWRITHAGAPAMYADPDGLWQGPFNTLMESQRYRFRHTIDRTRMLQGWGIHALPIKQLWWHGSNTWIQFESPISVKRADWRVRVVRAPNRGEVTVLDLRSVRLARVLELEPSVWSAKPKLLAAMLATTSVLAYLGIRPGCLVAHSGDSSRITVVGVDETRASGPITQTVKDQRWHQMLFGKCDKELYRAIEAAMDTHHEPVLAALHRLRSKTDGADLSFLVPDPRELRLSPSDD